MTEPLEIDGARAERVARHWALAAGAMAALAGVGLLSLSGWFLTGAALAGAGGPAAVQAFNYLLPSAAIRGFAIVRTLGRYGERLLGHRAALLVLADLRPRLFARLAAASPQQVAGLDGGEVASHLGDDVEALENLAIRQVSIGSALAGAAAGLAAAVLAGPAAAAALATGLLASAAISAYIAPRWLAPAHAAHADALRVLRASHVGFAASSIEIAVYGLAPQVAETLALDAAQADKARVHIVHREATLQGLQTLLAALTVALVMALSRATLPITAFAALAAAATFEAWGGVVHALVQVPRVQMARMRLDAIVNLPARGQAATPLDGKGLSITAGAVTVSIQAGGRLRICGASGSGKSRMLGTIAGLRADAPEIITIDGLAVQSLEFDALRALFALSAQDAPLLAGTVADNLRLARPGVDELEMWHALNVACLDEVVRAMPQGLETWLGNQGARLSGGQRKRLSLARALLAGRPWLLLDEPSEGLDIATERRLAEHLDAWLRETGNGLVLANHRPGLNRLCANELQIS